MSQTGTYSDLVERVEALLGADFHATEDARVKHLVNRRAWFAYRESDYWLNTLVVGEERAVDDSTDGDPVVPYEGPVVDEGEASPYTGSVDTFIRIHRERAWHDRSVDEYEFQAMANGVRLVGFDVAYGLEVTPTATENNSFTSGDITIGAYVDAWVGGTIKLDDYTGAGDDNSVWNDTHTITGVNYGSNETVITIEPTFSALTTFSTGIGTAQFPSVFCSYKQRLEDTYGDGSGETTAIPREWYEYIAHGAYADMLRADGQYEYAQIEESSANMALQRELERLDRMHIAQTVGKRIATHGTEQSRYTATY